LVTRVVAGYDYVGNWVSSTPGLSPVGMPASFAATLSFFHKNKSDSCDERPLRRILKEPNWN
jgi:hypothetical protein